MYLREREREREKERESERARERERTFLALKIAKHWNKLPTSF